MYNHAISTDENPPKHKLLEVSANKDSREACKDAAVEARESGELADALKMFAQVVAWDKKNDNLRGQIDAMGHMRITYTRLADEEVAPEKQVELKIKALEIAEEAITLAEAGNIPEGAVAIQKVQFASALLDVYREMDEPQRTEKLEKALETVNAGIETLPGSTAHKAWPSNAKAKLEYLLGRTAESVKTLTQAEIWLFEGYTDEVKNDDQAELKINVWLSGIHITFAEICMQENKPILARHYANSVLTINDPAGTLAERKKEAQRILNKVA